MWSLAINLAIRGQARARKSMTKKEVYVRAEGSAGRISPTSRGSASDGGGAFRDSRCVTDLESIDPISMLENRKKYARAEEGSKLPFIGLRYSLNMPAPSAYKALAQNTTSPGPKRTAP